MPEPSLLEAAMLVAAVVEMYEPRFAELPPEVWLQFSLAVEDLNAAIKRTEPPE